MGKAIKIRITCVIEIDQENGTAQLILKPNMQVETEVALKFHSALAGGKHVFPIPHLHMNPNIFFVIKDA